MKELYMLSHIFPSVRSIKLYLLGIFLFYNTPAFATTYYFSSSAGSDDYTNIQAQNASTPWRSLKQLNFYFKFLSSGDSVLFKKGDVFYGGIIASKSGAVFAPIYFGAYGTGENPVLNGLSPLVSWKLVKNGIYEASCNYSGSTLLINGVQQAIGRFPNKGYLSYESHQENSITDDQLLYGEDWTGAEVVIRKNRWVIDKSLITGQAGGKISYTSGNKALPTNGYGYFIQKSIKTLDQFGEWYYNDSRKSMLVFFGTKNPANYNVETSAVTNIIDIEKFNYLSFENLVFKGAGSNAFKITQAKRITIKNCAINLSGQNAFLVSYSSFFTIKNSTINHSLNEGLNLDAGCSNSVILNNEIKNTALIPGMGNSGTGTYEAITSFGDNTQIERNQIDSVGYNGIYFGGNSSYVKNNFITYFCLTKDDGAGIYIGDWSKTANKKVTGNIILHGIGNNSGTNSTNSYLAEGIYIDDNTESVIISDNTVSMCADNGIKIHNAKDIDIHNNVVFDNGVQLRLEQDHYLATSSYIRNNRIRNNTFFSASARQPTAKFSTHQNDISSFGQIDSNFYCKHKKELSAIIASIVKNGKGENRSYNFSTWQAAYGKDQFSTETPSDDYILFEYNFGTEIKTVLLKKPYFDVHHKVYKDKITINPYSSVLLVASEANLPQLVASKLVR